MDYHADTCVADVRALTNDGLAFAADCITTPASMALCYAALGGQDVAAGARYVCLDTIPVAAHSRRSVRPSMALALTAFGCAVDWRGGYRCEATPREREFAAAWTVEVEELLRVGAVVPMRYEVVGTGLELQCVEEGLRKLSSGQVSGTKLVCVVDDTTS